MGLVAADSPIWEAALSNNTKAAYRSAFTTYKVFANMTLQYDKAGKLAFPDESILIRYVDFLHHSRQLAYTSIKLYLSAVRHNFIMSHGSDPTLYLGSPYPRLQLFLRGVKRLQGPPIDKRKPITVDIVFRMCQFLDSHGLLGFPDDIMLSAAITTAFWGLLRCSEFTVIKNFHYNENLAANDIRWLDNNRLSFELNLKQSKTDIFRQGVSIFYSAVGNSICPVFRLNKYLKWRTLNRFPPDGPLFLKDGSALTRAQFVSSIKELTTRLGLDSNEFNSHSFRKGCASSAAAAAVPTFLIQILGRWRSDSYKRYISVDRKQIIAAHKAICGDIPLDTHQPK